MRANAWDRFLQVHRRASPLLAEAGPTFRAIVVGEEGGSGDWPSKRFVPKHERSEQEFPGEVVAEIAGRSSGWYFVRFYDADYDFIHSLDFRFVSSLRDITVPPNPAFPPPGGHLAAAVRFLHDGELCVEQSPAAGRNVLVKRADSETMLTFPPLPGCDRTSWSAGCARCTEGRDHDSHRKGLVGSWRREGRAYGMARLAAQPFSRRL